MSAQRLLEDREKIGRLVEVGIPFDRLLGMRTREIGDGFAVLELPFRGELVGNPLLGALHGGVISALLDVCGGAAVWSRVGLEKVVSTVDLRVDFLRPSQRHDVLARGRVVRLGNRVGVVELRAYAPGDEERPVAAGTGVYNLKSLSHAEQEGLRRHLATMVEAAHSGR